MDIITELFNQSEVIAIVLIPIVAGIVEVFKTAFNIQYRFLPLMSLLIGGLISGLLAISLNQPIAQSILIGFIAGLGASGLYDNIKKVGKING